MLVEIIELSLIFILSACISFKVPTVLILELPCHVLIAVFSTLFNDKDVFISATVVAPVPPLLIGIVPDNISLVTLPVLSFS